MNKKVANCCFKTTKSTFCAPSSYCKERYINYEGEKLMLKWNVTHIKEYCPREAVRRKRRRPNEDIVGIILIVAALLVLFLVLPAWVIAVIVCAAMIALGLIWLLT